ncbi:MAG TPA: DNA repair protein RecN [Firmicutes bacterium]|uniref:DNA repair protein RecN n=1 Tax=Capillibacterium thermochitinicola TaxID=2699427 RepID=A0A8J6I1T3_9FIRM|nr:DNA repair protein RecN [Capillibacterium thermochitinicola]MBA2133134.1 DNA repair protein RecN [Capillibacterium thermochitinicola]HHW11824.1 DNA repair protein RecN [Bacillota bacterium]
MLRELMIENFALIDRLSLEFGPGFNVLTGETGAGKSIIIDTVSLLLGGRSSWEQIRAGAESARIEGVFELEERPEIDNLLAGWGIPVGDDRLLVVSREIKMSGRSRCRMNGQNVTVLTLNEVGRLLMDIHGQHEHQSLFSPVFQRALLDRFGGEHLKQEAARVAELYTKWQGVKKELADLEMDEAEEKRRVELYSFQLQEIEAARLQPGEEEELSRERNLLAGAERLYTYVSEAYHRFYGRDDGGAILDHLGTSVEALSRAAEIDPQLRPWVETANRVACEVEEVARELRAYRDQITFDPERLNQVEERLDEIAKLKRKYGPGIPEILDYAAKLRKELASLSDRTARQQELTQQLATLEAELGRAVQALSALRRETADRLETAVMEQLHEVNMGKTVFKVALNRIPDPRDGLEINGEKVAVGKDGIDQVEFMVAPNPGEGLRPLARIASGGELSRLMLVLKVILAEADQIPAMVFDEIDTGIGGRTAQAVAEKLLLLGCTHQVICVTHLPQIASLAHHHYYIEKTTHDERTTIKVRALDQEERVEELARMLGGAEVTTTTREHAREMLQLAATLRSDRNRT